MTERFDKLAALRAGMAATRTQRWAADEIARLEARCVALEAAMPTLTARFWAFGPLARPPHSA